MKDKSTFKEFKQFFRVNPVYIKLFNQFAQGIYSVQSMTAPDYNKFGSALFTTFINLIAPSAKYTTRVEYIKEWCGAEKGRTARVHKLYGSDSILYKINEHTLTDETWNRLVDAMNKVAIEEAGLTELFPEFYVSKSMRVMKSTFIDFFTESDDTARNAFNIVMGIENYTQDVLNNAIQFTRVAYDNFELFKDGASLIAINDYINEYFLTQTHYKYELVSLLWKQTFNDDTKLEDLIKELDNSSLEVKRNIIGIINLASKIYL